MRWKVCDECTDGVSPMDGPVWTRIREGGDPLTPMEGIPSVGELLGFPSMTLTPSGEQNPGEGCNQ